MRILKLVLPLTLVCLLAAACASGNDDDGPARAAEPASQPADESPEPVVEAEPASAAETPQESEATQDPEPGSDTSGGSDIIQRSFRTLIYGSLVEEAGVSEESAQCVVDNITDEMVDAYIEFTESEPSDEPPQVLVDLMRIQNTCLTPQELEMMGFMPSDLGSNIETGSQPCPSEDGSEQQLLDFDGPQPMCLDPSRQYTAVFDTTAGEMRFALDMVNTPITANNFAVLARYHYYDGTLLFRTDPSIGIIQGGAPHTNSPSDPGPGYTIPDEGIGFIYEPGQIVMARTAAPGSAGAQFFFAVNENTSLLNNQGTYVVFGQMDDASLAVAEAILASHVDQPDNRLGGGPEPAVVVNSVTIEETG